MKKKWFVGLMVLLGLVLVQSAAMAVADYRVCSNCWEYRNGTTEYITDPKEIETSWDMHTDRIFTCSVCSEKTVLWSLHYGGGATCTTEGTCDFCHVPYKDSSVHTGPYTYSYSKTSDTRHNVKATCMGCRRGAGTYSAKHEETEAATCKTAAYCGLCRSRYGEKDPNNHTGKAYTISATKISETLHTPKLWYECCGYMFDGDPTEHRILDEATCINEAHCVYCRVKVGTRNPDNHVGTPTTTYVKTSENQHTAKITYSVCKHTVDGVSTAHTAATPATCIAAAYCAVCKSSYGSTDPNAHDLVQYDAQAPTCTEIGWNAYEACKNCTYTTYSALDVNPNNHVGTPTTTYVKTSENQHTAKITYSVCKHTVDGESTDHTQTTAATCLSGAYCADCKSYYGEVDPDAHDLVQHDAQAPTCFHVGWDAYETCSRCDYTTYVEKSALGHWYGEWTPNADGTNSASCLRDAYEYTVDCVRFSFVLTAEDVRTEFVLCPVCGEVSEIRMIDENGEVVETREAVRLLLVEDAKAEALTERLPRGELVVRMGALESGEVLMSVAFEIGGKLTQPTGQVKITLPAEVLEGHTLSLLAEDGTEAELTLEGDEEEETVSFTLDFTNSETPVQVIRLIPEV